MIIEAVSPVARTVSWSDGCRVTGSPIGTDASPNSTPPAASRILRVDHKTAGTLYRVGLAGNFAIVALAESGTSVVAAKWYFDATLGVWVKYGAPTTTFTSGSVLAVNDALIIAPGIQWFFQVTTVNGAVTAFSYAFG